MRKSYFIEKFDYESIQFQSVVPQKMDFINIWIHGIEGY